MLVCLLNVHHIHVSCRVGGVGPDFPIHLDMALHENGCDLCSSQGIPAKRPGCQTFVGLLKTIVNCIMLNLKVLGIYWPAYQLVHAPLESGLLTQQGLQASVALLALRSLLQVICWAKRWHSQGCLGFLLEPVPKHNDERQAFSLLVWAWRRLGGLHECVHSSARSKYCSSNSKTDRTRTSIATLYF